MLRASLLPLCVALCAASPPPPLEIAEADRLMGQARARGQAAGAAVDITRLAALGPWLPEGDLEARLAALAVDADLAPLVQAVAWWQLRQAANGRLDVQTARRADAALGLLDGWVGRSGAAPHPTAPLREADGWRPLPGPVLWLEAAFRPAQDTEGTVATRLHAEVGGPAVLRLGFDDTVAVRLNGDEIYKSDAAHSAWLDQAAVPVTLRPGDNTLVVEVGQQSGAWRLLARITDAEGVPLPGLSAHPDPWGPIPDPAGEPAGDAAAEPAPEPQHLWPALAAAADLDPPDAQALRDLADYARVSGLPDREMAVERVAIEGAWTVDPSPRTLWAWLQILPEDERAAVRAAHAPQRPVTLADVVADRRLALADAWTHYYARRHQATRAALAAVLADDPGWPPARRLEAIFLADLGLPHRAVARLQSALEARPDRVSLARALIHAQRSAGRVLEALAGLDALIDADEASPDDRFELADLRARRGEYAEAIALLDEVTRALPGRTTFALEAADVVARSGDGADATRRLEALRARLPDDAVLAEALARRYQAEGRTADALPLVQQALVARPGDDGLLSWLKALTTTAPAPRLGPDLATLSAQPSPAVPAHVLYHHARADVGEDGRAVRRVRRVVRVLTEEGARRFSEWSLPFVPGTQRLEIETARRVRAGRPDASPRRSERDLSAPEDRLYFDLRAEVLTFDRPQPGDLIEVAWTLADTSPDPAFPGYYGELAYLQEAAPRAQSVVEVGGPRADRLQVTVVAPGLTVTRTPTRIEARDVPGVPLEAHMPGPSSVQAYVHLSTATGWAEVNQRYEALLGDRLTAPAPLVDVARAWAGDARTPEDILARLYTQVADRTRYVGLEFGVRSFQPAPPAVTLARGYGDCKDKATLLIALAGALGVDARLTLTRTRGSGHVAPEPASFALFDHAIVYVPALDRFMDPTVDRNDPWTLPPSDQGAQVFVIGHDTGLRVVPPQPAAHSVNDWRLTGTLAPDGTLSGDLDLTMTGQAATLARRQLEGTGDPAGELARLLGGGFPGITVTPPTFDGLRPARDPVTARAGLTLPAFPARGAGRTIPAGVGRWNLVARYAEAAQRETVRELRFRHTQRLTVTLALPPGWRASPPPPVVRTSPFGRVSVTVEAQPGRLVLTSEVVIDTIAVSPQAYPAFRAWLAEADEALSAPVEVTP